MRYTVRKSIVWIVGEIWMPYGSPCSQVKELSAYDVENARNSRGKITRKSLDQWLSMNAGDFSRIIDFSASIEDGEKTIDIPWNSEDGEMAYNDTLPAED